MKKEQIAKLAKSIHVMQEFNPYDFVEGDAAGLAAGAGSSATENIGADTSANAGPKVSIYIPVKHEDRAERQDAWDKIEFKDLMETARYQLQKFFANTKADAIIERLNYIAQEPDLPLWIDASNGLAFLVSEKEALVFNMNHAPKAQVCVGKTFCIMPLIYDMQLTHSAWTDKCAARKIEPHDVTREIMFETEQGEQEKIVQKVGLALAKDKASTDIDDIALALTERKVAVLFIQKDAHFAGRYDAASGKVEPAKAAACADEDLLEAFIRAALLQEAAAYVLDTDKMPTEAPICAMYRY
jgi:hypothetical protein